MLGRKALIAMTFTLCALPGVVAAQDSGRLSVSDFLPPSATFDRNDGTTGLANGFEIETVATLYEHLRLAQWRQATASNLAALVAESDRRWENRYGVMSVGHCRSRGTLTANMPAIE